MDGSLPSPLFPPIGVDAAMAGFVLGRDPLETHVVAEGRFLPFAATYRLL